MAANEENNKEEFLSMGSMLEGGFKELEEGKLIKAKVLGITKDGIIVDIGYKSDGMIPIKEFTGLDNKVHVNVGDEVEVLLERMEDSEGILILSKYKADRIKNLDSVEKAYKDRDIVDAKIIREVKGGFMVDIGVDAFLPNSQFLKDEPGLADPINKTVPSKIIKFGRKKGEIVISHKVAVKDKDKRVKKEVWDTLVEGEVRKGIVKSLTSYGAFIDIGGVTGLLHISDMSWGKVTHPAEILAIDSEIEIKIIKIDKEKRRVSFGLKQLQVDPWATIEDNYPINTVITGKVVNIVDYGAFIKLEEGIEGLLHISDLSWTRRIKNPSELLAVGDTIEVKILNIDRNNRKILFGLKQLESDPFTDVEGKYPAGSKVNGMITGYSGSAIFVELEEGIEAVLHKKDISWTKKFSNLKGLYRKGERVEVVVLNIDKVNRKIQVGVKQLSQDPWVNEIPNKYKEGTVVTAKVVRVANFGVFLELEEGLEGFIHISELSVEPVLKIEDAVKTGSEITSKVIKLDLEGRKIGLSVKQLHIEQEKKDIEKYSDTKEPKATFGDIINPADKKE